jgi:transposase-like protein
MKINLFHKLLKELEKLTYTQSKQAEDVLHKKCSLKSLEDVMGDTNECPHCQSTSFYKWGVRANLQRYRCNKLS